LIKLALTEKFNKEKQEESLTLSEEASVEEEPSAEELNKRFESLSPALKRRRTLAMAARKLTLKK